MEDIGRRRGEEHSAPGFFALSTSILFQAEIRSRGLESPLQMHRTVAVVVTRRLNGGVVSHDAQRLCSKQQFDLLPHGLETVIPIHEDEIEIGTRLQ